MNDVNVWPIVHLATLAVNKKGAMAGGPFGSDLVCADYVLEGVPVIRGTNLPRGSRLSLDNLVFVGEGKADALRLNCALPGDLVFTQRGTLGQIGLIPQDSPYPRYVISQSQMKMTVDTGKADPLYLYYFFTMPSTGHYIENHALQAGVPHINLGILKKMEVIAPPVEVQRKIAGVLSACDDLIANNQRRIALLESMAEEIYREWFVRMRFPARETTAFKKGVPEGWSQCRLKQCCRIIKGKSYAAEDVTDDEMEMPFITLKSFQRGGGYRADGLKHYAGEFKAEQVVKQGDLIMAVTDMTQAREVVGRPARVPDLGERGGVISLDVIKLVPANVDPTFIYLHLRHSGFAERVKEFANGANVLHLKSDVVGEQPIYLPIVDLQTAFAKQVEPMLRLAEDLAVANASLGRIRDSLIPRLISGKLRVDHLDIRFPPSMQDVA